MTEITRDQVDVELRNLEIALNSGSVVKTLTAYNIFELTLSEYVQSAPEGFEDTAKKFVDKSSILVRRYEIRRKIL